jgi:hypothetical protein
MADPPDSFTTFGELLRCLRQRARLIADPCTGALLRRRRLGLSAVSTRHTAPRICHAPASTSSSIDTRSGGDLAGRPSSRQYRSIALLFATFATIIVSGFMFHMPSRPSLKSLPVRRASCTGSAERKGDSCCRVCYHLAW